MKKILITTTLGALIAIGSVNIVRAQWIENGNECHMDVNAVTCSAPRPEASGTPPSGGTVYYGGGTGGGSGTGYVPPSTGEGQSGGAGHSGPIEGGTGLRFSWDDIVLPDFNPQWDDFLPTLRAIVFCERMVGHPSGNWRVYFAFNSESAFMAEEECRSWLGTAYVMWNSRRPPGGSL